MLDSITSRTGLRCIERRRVTRAPVSLGGRLFCARKGRELPCTLIDISPAGAAIECEHGLSRGDQIVFYIDTLGRYEGTVVATSGARISIRFTYSNCMREKIANKITYLLGLPLSDGPKMRSAPRTMTLAMSTFTWSDGKISDCAIADISLTGAFLMTQARPSLNEIVQLGSCSARVVRHQHRGIGVEFVPRNTAVELVA